MGSATFVLVQIKIMKLSYGNVAENLFIEITNYIIN